MGSCQNPLQAAVQKEQNTVLGTEVSKMGSCGTESSCEAGAWSGMRTGLVWCPHGPPGRGRPYTGTFSGCSRGMGWSCTWEQFVFQVQCGKPWSPISCCWCVTASGHFMGVCGCPGALPRPGLRWLCCRSPGPVVNSIIANGEEAVLRFPCTEKCQMPQT